MNDREELIARQKLAVVRGVPIESVESHRFYRFEQVVPRAVFRRHTVFERELLTAHEVGREIVKLREEKANPLDTMWIATSPSQLKILWSKVSELPQQEATSLGKEALAIAPLELG